MNYSEKCKEKKYNPNCNPIENFFSQLKNYVKNKSLKYKNL